jgi:hypothetical protein
MQEILHNVQRSVTIFKRWRFIAMNSVVTYFERGLATGRSFTDRKPWACN